MSTVVEPLRGAARFVVLAAGSEAIRGTASEFRHAGLAVVHRTDVVSALNEVIREPGSILVLSSEFAPDVRAQVLELAMAVCEGSVVLARGPSADATVVRTAFALGVRTTVPLPITPERLTGVLRVAPPVAHGSDVVHTGDLMIDPRRHLVEWRGVRVDVSPREFSVLLCLARAFPHMVTLDELASEYFESTSDPYASVRVLVNKIRARLGASDPDTAPIETVRGVGYRLAS